MLMNLWIKALCTLILFMVLAVEGKSQRYLGIATSDWNAINSLYLNPANIADCREKISIGIFSLNMSVDNNLGHLPKIEDIYRTTNGDNNLFTNSGKTNFSM